MKNLCLAFVAISLLCSACKKKPVGGDLVNTYWTLTTLQSGTKVTNISTPITLTISKEGLSGDAPCNSYFSDYNSEGASLTVTGLGVTKRMCDDINLENQYLLLLGKAHSYSVLTDKLVIFAEGGELTFAGMSDKDREKIDFQNGVGQLVANFPKLQSNSAPHLYPIVRVDNPGDYPFQGTKVDTTSYRFFDGQSSSIWNSTGGDVYAIGQYGEYYVCRVPGRYVSSDIALFQLKNGRLMRSETVAWAWCDEGWCNQQDAWLEDLNNDSKLDIVQRYTLTDDKGKVREQHLRAMIQGEDGTFTEDKGRKLDASKYKMAKI